MVLGGGLKVSSTITSWGWRVSCRLALELGGSKRDVQLVGSSDHAVGLRLIVSKVVRIVVGFYRTRGRTNGRDKPSLCLIVSTVGFQKPPSASSLLTLRGPALEERGSTIPNAAWKGCLHPAPRMAQTFH